MNLKSDNIFTAILVLCAAVTTSLVARHEYLGRQTAVARLSDQKPVFIDNWKSQLGSGIRLGASNAPIQLIEFADFECPYCGDFHKKLKLLQERYPTKISLTYVHFPLPMHRFAIPAARAAECAGDQGRFEAMYDRLFDDQDFLGLKSWSEYATAAGVPNLSAFDICLKGTDAIRRIEEGKLLGTRLNIKVTPTLIINGWMLGQPPSFDELDKMVEAVLAGRSPVTAVNKS